MKIQVLEAHLRHDVGFAYIFIFIFVFAALCGLFLRFEVAINAQAMNTFIPSVCISTFSGI